jgi:hypothetical protein
MENPVTARIGEDAASRFAKTENTNVFVMMRYDEGADYERLEGAIKSSLKRFGFNGVLARDKRFRPQLWDNIEFCMRHSRYGVVVFEQNPRRPEFNPNVSVELGFMMALKKDCLILKEKELPHLPTDILGHLYTEFHRDRMESEVEAAIRSWLEGLNHIQFSETLSHADPIEAKKVRTRRIIEALKSLPPEPNAIIRQGGALSSLAISKRETLLESSSKMSLKQLLLEEKNQFIGAIDSGVTVRCIICPALQTVAVDLNLIAPDFVRSDVTHRIDEMIRMLTYYRRSTKLQVVYVARMPHENVLMVGDEMFIGRRRLNEWGFPSTTIVRDPELLQSEIAEFDLLFDDAARALLCVDRCTESDYGSSRLKTKIKEHLVACRNELERGSSISSGSGKRSGGRGRIQELQSARRAKGK